MERLTGFAPGSRVAGYVLAEEIGRGGMAVVYRARDERLGRIVALKLIRPAAAADPSFRERFIREIRAITAVGHPHVIPVYEADEADGTLYLAMRLVSGGSLQELVDRKGALRPGLAATIIGDVASALDAVHGMGLVHRDVKPANILLDTAAGPPFHGYLADFGLIREISPGQRLSATGEFLGTVHYGAPEQVGGAELDGRADQYALAGVAVTVLTGRPAYPRRDGLAVRWAHLREPPPAVMSRRRRLSRAVDEVIARGMAKSPADRYASCGEFAAALRAALGVPGGGRRLRRALRARRLALGGAGLVILAAASLIAAVASSGSAITATPGPQLSMPAGTPAFALAFGPGDATLTACTGRSAGEWDLARPSRPSSLITVNATEACALSPDGGQVAAEADGVISIWDMRAGPRSATIHATSQPIALSATGTLAVAVDGDVVTGADLDSATTGKRIARLSNPGDAGQVVRALALSPDGSVLLTVTDGGFFDYWDVGTRTEFGSFDPIPNVTEDVTSAVFSADGTRQAIVTTDETYVLGVQSQDVIGTIATPGNGFLAISPHGTIVARASGAQVQLMDVASGSVLATLTDQGGTGAVAAAFSADGRDLAIGDTDGRVYTWRLSGAPR